MICWTIGRTVIFSQVGLPTINGHPRPDPVPVFVRYPRHQMHLSHRPRSGSGAGIRVISRDLRGDSHEYENKTK
jgi:hypothetical protein